MTLTLDNASASFLEPDLFALGPQSWPFDGLEAQAYGLIMADPPWRFQNYSDAGQAKGAEPQYRTMTDEAIMLLPVGDLARADCLLWLWATWPKLPLAMQCLDWWGFEYVTGGAWDKQRWGTGYVVRSVCEPFLLAKRGNPRADGRSVPNLIRESRREHSRKPDAAYEYAERMLPQARRCEVFARTMRRGWDTWGDEDGKFGEASA